MSKPHQMTPEQMQAELAEQRKDGFYFVAPFPDEWFTPPPAPRLRFRLRLRLRINSLREKVAAWICPWDIHDTY